MHISHILYMIVSGKVYLYKVDFKAHQLQNDMNLNHVLKKVTTKL